MRSYDFIVWFGQHCIGKSGTNRRGYSTSYEAYGRCRDELERFTVDGKYRSLTYRLWEHPMFSLHIDEKLGQMVFGSWDSNLTRDRLDGIARYFKLPFGFVMREGELYCSYAGAEMRFKDVYVDLNRCEFVVQVVAEPYDWYDVIPFDKSKLRNLEQFKKWEVL